MDKIEIYTRPGCTYCVSAKHYLEQHGLAYTEYDVTKDPARLVEMLSRTVARSLPQIFINDESVGGFDALLDKHDLSKPKTDRTREN